MYRTTNVYFGDLILKLVLKS